MFDKYEQDIEQIVQVVFSTMLDVEAHRIQTPESSNESLAAFIQIAGEWNGSVMMGFTGPSATGCASQMLGVPAEELTDGDLRDVAAEVVTWSAETSRDYCPGSHRCRCRRLSRAIPLRCTCTKRCRRA